MYQFFQVGYFFELLYWLVVVPYESYYALLTNGNPSSASRMDALLCERRLHVARIVLCISDRVRLTWIPVVRSIPQMPTRQETKEMRCVANEGCAFTPHAAGLRVHSTLSCLHAHIGWQGRPSAKCLQPRVVPYGRVGEAQWIPVWKPIGRASPLTHVDSEVLGILPGCL